MNYKIKGRVTIEGDIFELEFENIEEYIRVAKQTQLTLGERVALYYNDIPLEMAANIGSEEDIEMIEEQMKEVDEDYEEY